MTSSLKNQACGRDTAQEWVYHDNLKTTDNNAKRLYCVWSPSLRFHRGRATHTYMRGTAPKMSECSSPLERLLLKRARVPLALSFLRLVTVSRMMFAIDLCRSVIPAMSMASAVTAAAAIAMIVESSFSFDFDHVPHCNL